MDVSGSDGDDEALSSTRVVDDMELTLKAGTTSDSAGTPFGITPIADATDLTWALSPRTIDEYFMLQTTRLPSLGARDIVADTEDGFKHVHEYSDRIEEYRRMIRQLQTERDDLLVRLDSGTEAWLERQTSKLQGTVRDSSFSELMHRTPADGWSQVSSSLRAIRVYTDSKGIFVNRISALVRSDGSISSSAVSSEDEDKSEEEWIEFEDVRVEVKRDHSLRRRTTKKRTLPRLPSALSSGLTSLEMEYSDDETFMSGDWDKTVQHSISIREDIEHLSSLEFSSIVPDSLGTTSSEPPKLHSHSSSKSRRGLSSHRDSYLLKSPPPRASDLLVSAPKAHRAAEMKKLKGRSKSVMSRRQTEPYPSSPSSQHQRSQSEQETGPKMEKSKKKKKSKKSRAAEAWSDSDSDEDDDVFGGPTIVALAKSSGSKSRPLYSSKTTSHLRSLSRDDSGGFAPEMTRGFTLAVRTGLSKSFVMPTRPADIYLRLRRRFDGKRPIRVLALDGGGLRAIVTGELLKEFAKGAGEVPIHQCFDLIVGTSAGGIMAVQMAKLGWDVPKMAWSLDVIAKKFFDKKTSGLKKFYKLMAEEQVYDTDGFRNQTHANMFGSETAPGMPMFGRAMDGRGPHCAVTVVRSDLIPWRPFLFRSYDLRNTVSCWDGTHIATVTEAFSGTTAAPVVMKPFRMKAERIHGKDATVLGKKITESDFATFLDGGVWCNNPTLASYFEARDLFGHHREVLLVSVGTGHLPKKWKERENIGWLKTGGDIAHGLWESREVLNNQVMRQLLREQDNFFRFDITLEKHENDKASLVPYFVQRAQRWLRKYEMKRAELQALGKYCAKFADDILLEAVPQTPSK